MAIIRSWFERETRRRKSYCMLVVPLSMVPVARSMSNNIESWSVDAPTRPARNTQDRAWMVRIIQSMIKRVLFFEL